MPAMGRSTQLFAQDDDMRTRFAAKSKADLIWDLWVHQNPTANHEAHRTLYLGAIALGLPMSHIISYLEAYSDSEASQDESSEGEQ